MHSFGLTDKGRYRAENQDSFEVRELGENTLAVVCDGMGGEAAGLLASDMAISRFADFAGDALDPEDGAQDEDVLRQAVTAANRQVYHFSCTASEYAGMGTTLVAGVFRPGAATFINVGDSRAYRVARDGIVQITKDHSRVQQMVDAGELTPAQARRHPKRNIITRAVGSEAFVTSDLFTVPVREGDIFLLCSDGLTNAVADAELHRLILAAGDAEAACRSLIQAALGNNARDNITAIVVDPTKGGGERG